MTVADVEPEGAGPIVTAAVAVPWSATVWGESAASSVMFSVAVRIPAARGANVNGIRHFAAGVTVPKQLEVPSVKSFALNPFTTMLVTCREPSPVFVSVMFCGVLLVPCVVVPGKVKVPDGLRETAGTGGGGATAVPDRLIA